MTAINKVIFDDRVLIDLTADTVHPDRMYKGDTAHAADGTEIVGTAEIRVRNERLIMPEGLCYLLGTVDPETHRWVRPDYLPDLDEVYQGELNTIYMTVDATGRISDPHVYMRLWAACTVQVGYIENGEFVAESTTSVANGGYFTKVFTLAANSYPVVKIMGVSELRGFQFTTWTSAAGRVYVGKYQPVVEMVGHMNYADTSTQTGYFVEREKIRVTTAAANFLQYRWTNGYCLQEIDTSGWNTTNWAINSLYQTWYCCYNLQYLDVSHWDTSNWTLSSTYDMQYTWGQCRTLKELDLSAWDTSNWTVGSLAYTWTACTSLRKLNVSTWDTSSWTVSSMTQTWYLCFSIEDLYLPWNTSNWRVTNMSNTWMECWNLRSLDVHTWNTSNWAVTTISACWNSCVALKELDLRHWDTSSWRVTSMETAWRYCYSMERLDVSTWDTSDWPLVNLNYTWGNCSCLQSLDLSLWDTSGWDVKNLSQTWMGCQNLESLDVSTWDTSNWHVQSMSDTWSGDRHLLSLPIGNWDTSNWAVTSMASTWYACAQIETLPIGDWDVSNWRPTTMSSTFAWMARLRVLDLSNWDTSDWTAFTTKYILWPRNNPALTSFDFRWLNFSLIGSFRSGSTYAHENCYALQNITYGADNNGKMVSTDQTSVRYDWCPLLSHDSLINILNVIGTVSGKTLQLGSANLNKLTAEEKAIAQNKGWTLS